jgi:hypothetical protein
MNSKQIHRQKKIMCEYIPLDLNKNVILERLDRIICHYGEANESNESAFEFDVQTLIWQIEIYDQVWYARAYAGEGKP